MNSTAASGYLRKRPERKRAKHFHSVLLEVGYDINQGKRRRNVRRRTK